MARRHLFNSSIPPYIQTVILAKKFRVKLRFSSTHHKVKLVHCPSRFVCVRRGRIRILTRRASDGARPRRLTGFAWPQRIRVRVSFGTNGGNSRKPEDSNPFPHSSFCHKRRVSPLTHPSDTMSGKNSDEFDDEGLPLLPKHTKVRLVYTRYRNKHVHAVQLTMGHLEIPVADRPHVVWRGFLSRVFLDMRQGWLNRAEAWRAHLLDPRDAGTIIPHVTFRTLPIRAPHTSHKPLHAPRPSDSRSQKEAQKEIFPNRSRNAVHEI